MMPIPATQFLDHLLDQVNDRVKYGTEVAADATDSASWDSSELVEWAAKQAGASMPDGSWRQYKALHEQGGSVDPEVALRTPGALLFKFSSDPLSGIPGERQVLISLGNGKVIDASGTQVRIVDARADEFTHAAQIPQFTVDAANEEELRDHLQGRLDGVAPAVPPPAAEDQTPPATPPAPQAEPSAPPLVDADADPVALRKESLDARQRADELRAEAERGEAHKEALDLRGVDQLKAGYDKLDEATKLRAQAEQAKRESADLDGSAAEAKVSQSNDLIKQAEALESEGKQLVDEGNETAERVGLAQKAVADLRAEATSLDDRAKELFDQSTAAIDARMPTTALDGPSIVDDVDVPAIPPPPPAGSTEAQVREWVAKREQAESGRETKAAQLQKDASQLNDLGEVKTALAADAAARAGSAQAAVAAEEARMTGLQERLSTAKARADGLSDEMMEEQAQYEQLRDQGDTQGAALANARTDELMRQQMSWNSQVSSLEDRIAESQKALARAHEEATDYREVAARLTEEAGRATAQADLHAAEATKLQAEAERLDAETDAVEEALGRDVATTVQVVSSDGTITVEIPGRSLDDLTPEERSRLEQDLPGASGTAPATSDPTPPADGGSTDDGIDVLGVAAPAATHGDTAGDTSAAGADGDAPAAASPDATTPAADTDPVFADVDAPAATSDVAPEGDLDPVGADLGLTAPADGADPGAAAPDDGTVDGGTDDDGSVAATPDAVPDLDAPIAPEPIAPAVDSGVGDPIGLDAEVAGIDDSTGALALDTEPELPDGEVAGDDLVS